LLTNALNDKRGNFEKNSVHPSFCYKFLKFWQKCHILQKVQNYQPKTAEPKNFSFHILNPWVLRNTSQGGDHQICEEKAKSLHPNVQAFLDSEKNKYYCSPG